MPGVLLRLPLLPKRPFLCAVAAGVVVAYIYSIVVLNRLPISSVSLGSALRAPQTNRKDVEA